MKILLLDIETAPNLAHVWGMWQQNVGLPQLLAAGYVMCWSAKWYGQHGVMFDSVHQSSKKKMLRGIYQLLDEADVAVHYNGTSFDIPTLNKEFLECGMTPPAPYKQVDLLWTARKKFRFPSNKLDYIARTLGLGHKVPHKGHELWIECMAGVASAWRTMERYNKTDVVILEKVYDRMLPWIPNHPNHGTYDQTLVCPHCGGHSYQQRGWYYSEAYRYRKYQCTNKQRKCGKWFRGNKTEFRQRGERFVGIAA